MKKLTILLFLIPIMLLASCSLFTKENITSPQNNNNQTPVPTDSENLHPSNTKDKVKLAVCEYPPFISQNLKYQGVGIRIIKEAFELGGMDLEVGFFPWARALELSASGEWDAAATSAYSEERAKNYNFSDALYMSKGVFFHLKNYNFEWKTIDDLKNIPIGGTINYTYTPEFRKAAADKTINVEYVPSDSINMHKILEGRIKIFPVNIDVGYFILSQEFTPQERELFSYNANPISDTPTHVIFSKKIDKNLERIKKFNDGLKQLRDSGKIEQYFDESRKGQYVITNVTDINN